MKVDRDVVTIGITDFAAKQLSDLAQLKEKISNDTSCVIVHNKEGFLYLDGANLNALLGIVKPFDLGIDIMHFNLYKTFSTPHGGGGPDSGPVGAKRTLAAYLPVLTVEKNSRGLS